MPQDTGRQRFDVILSRGGDAMIDVTFRGARAEDVDATYELSAPFVPTGALVQRDLELFAACIQDFYVVQIDRTIVACAGIRRFAESAELFNVVVGEQWQGLGVGRFLLASMLIVLEAEGFAEAVVFTKTTGDWFARFGFTPMDPTRLPAERLAMLDPERQSVSMSRPIGLGAHQDGVDALPKLTDLRVRFARSGMETVWDGEIDSLLPFAEKNGIEVDSLCWGGVCGTCSTPLLEGTVSYHLRPDVDPGDGRILLCITRPVMNLVLDL